MALSNTDPPYLDLGEERSAGNSEHNTRKVDNIMFDHVHLRKQC